MDDDNYVNLRALLRLLASYPHTQDVYIGKPSLDRPIQATERISEHKVVSVSQGCTHPEELGRSWATFATRSLLIAVLLHPETRPLLVCHRRSWLLHQPRAGPKDGPMGQVSVPLIAATTSNSRVFLVLVVLGSLLPQQQQRLAWAVLSLP